MKRALITGVRRIGYHISRSLLEKGWRVGLVYRSSKEPVERLREEFGNRVVGLGADLSLWGESKRVVEEMVSLLGGVDAFLHLSSPYEATPLEVLKEEQIDLHFKPIAQAFLAIGKEIYPYMLQNTGDVKGRLIAFGDWATNTTPYRNYSAYFIAKGALHTAVKVLAKELAPHVLVNAIALGPTLRPPDIPEDRWQEYINRTPLKRPVSMQDVVKLTHYLLEVESMTGEIITLDSGRHVAGECA